METNIIDIVSKKCFASINEAIQHRNRTGIVCNHGVVISVDDLGREQIPVKLMDQITGLMRQYGIKNARYQKENKRFFGVTRLGNVIITPGNIPLLPRSEPDIHSDITITHF